MKFAVGSKLYYAVERHYDKCLLMREDGTKI